MSRERLFNLPATFDVSMSNQVNIGEFVQRFNLDLESSNTLSEYLKSPVQSGTTAEPEMSFESVFEAGMPGVMTLDQVRQEVDLGQWKMSFGNIRCKLEVRVNPSLFGQFDRCSASLFDTDANRME